MAFICKFCNSQFKTLYTLKTHENGSKKCLEKRGLKLETNICVGCNLSFFNKYNLKLHEDVCRNFLQHQHAKEILEKDKTFFLADTYMLNRLVNDDFDGYMKYVRNKFIHEKSCFYINIFLY